MVVLWPWYQHGAANHNHNYYHFNDYVAVTMTMQRADLARVELHLQPRPIATPSLPAGVPRVPYKTVEENAGCSGLQWVGAGVLCTMEYIRTSDLDSCARYRV